MRYRPHPFTSEDDLSANLELRKGVSTNSSLRCSPKALEMPSHGPASVANSFD
jgi:hypothetical protein